jgi:hypothetical protein
MVASEFQGKVALVTGASSAPPSQPSSAVPAQQSGFITIATMKMPLLSRRGLHLLAAQHSSLVATLPRSMTQKES